MLTQQQLDAYHRDGVLVVENIADEATLAAMRRALAGLIAQSASVAAHDDIYDLEPDHTAANPRLRRIKQPHLHHAIDPEKVPLDYEDRIACVGKAGTITIHHTFAVHGSAANTSQRPRPFLLYELMTADAWPLMGVRDVDEFDSRMVCGEKTYSPRMEAVPVRLPLPPADNLGSIYENQGAIKNRYFTASIVAN